MKSDGQQRLINACPLKTALKLIPEKRTVSDGANSKQPKLGQENELFFIKSGLNTQNNPIDSEFMGFQPFFDLAG